jgi:hypothetical protein
MGETERERGMGTGELGNWNREREGNGNWGKELGKCTERRGKWEQESRGEGNGNSAIGECYITGEMESEC